jgi:protein-tyrosine-phosphatase
VNESDETLAATTEVPAVLFLCVHNAGRSQMALGWLRQLGADGVIGYSGGSEPKREINEVAVQAMAEVGVDISGGRPKAWSRDVLEAVNVVVTMGCGDSCPVVPGTRYEDWEITDPAGRSLDEVRPIRDEIEMRVRDLLHRLDVDVHQDVA